MKQLILFSLLAFSIFSYAMEQPANSTQDSAVSTENFIQYMGQACCFVHHHNLVQFWSYTLLWAIQENNNEIFDAALAKWNHYKANSLELLEFTRRELACPFVSAAARGNCYAMQKLLDRSKATIINDSCKVHQSSECFATKCTALTVASQRGNSVAVTALLTQPSIDVELADKNNRTALMGAIEHDKISCTHALLRGAVKKANPNARMPDKSFGSVLHWALSLGDRNQHVKALLDNGADKDLIYKEKEHQQEGTPLMVAVAYANKEGVELLLAAKAKRDIPHPFSKMTAKELAEMKCQIEQNPDRKRTREQIIALLADDVITQTPGA